MTYTFEWTDSNGNGKRKDCTTSDEGQAWAWALQNCGWENRTSLGLVGDCKARQIRNGIVKNWWQAMSDHSLYKFNTLYLAWNLNDRLRSGYIKLVNT